MTDKGSSTLHVYAQYKSLRPIYQSLWVPSSNRLVILGKSTLAQNSTAGFIQTLELSRCDFRPLKENTTATVFKCGTFGASDLETRHLATGDFAGNLQIWDLEHLQLPIFSAKGHSIIHSIDGCGGGSRPGPPELVTSSKERVSIWDTRENKPVASIEASIGTPGAPKTLSDCWAVCFGLGSSDADRCVFAGYSDGDLRAFDLRNFKQRWRENVGHGICSLSCDDKYTAKSALVVTTTKSTVRVYDEVSGVIPSGFVEEKTSQSTVWCGRFVPQNKCLLFTSGGNGTVHLYRRSPVTAKEPKAALLASISPSKQPVLSIDCHPDKEGLLLANSLDQTVHALLYSPPK